MITINDKLLCAKLKGLFQNHALNKKAMSLDMTLLSCIFSILLFDKHPCPVFFFICDHLEQIITRNCLHFHVNDI